MSFAATTTSDLPGAAQVLGTPSVPPVPAVHQGANYWTTDCFVEAFSRDRAWERAVVALLNQRYSDSPVRRVLITNVPSADDFGQALASISDVGTRRPPAPWQAEAAPSTHENHRAPTLVYSFDSEHNMATIWLCEECEPPLLCPLRGPPLRIGTGRSTVSPQSFLEALPTMRIQPWSCCDDAHTNARVSNLRNAIVAGPFDTEAVRYGDEEPEETECLEYKGSKPKNPSKIAQGPDIAWSSKRIKKHLCKYLPQFLNNPAGQSVLKLGVNRQCRAEGIVFDRAESSDLIEQLEAVAAEVFPPLPESSVRIEIAPVTNIPINLRQHRVVVTIIVNTRPGIGFFALKETLELPIFVRGLQHSIRLLPPIAAWWAHRRPPDPMMLAELRVTGSARVLVELGTHNRTHIAGIAVGDFDDRFKSDRYKQLPSVVREIVAERPHVEVVRVVLFVTTSFSTTLYREFSSTITQVLHSLGLLWQTFHNTGIRFEGFVVGESLETAARAQEIAANCPLDVVDCWCEGLAIDGAHGSIPVDFEFVSDAVTRILPHEELQRDHNWLACATGLFDHGTVSWDSIAAGVSFPRTSVVNGVSEFLNKLPRRVDIVGSFPGCGKSIATMQFAYHVALQPHLFVVRLLDNGPASDTAARDCWSTWSEAATLDRRLVVVCMSEHDCRHLRATQPAKATLVLVSTRDLPSADGETDDSLKIPISFFLDDKELDSFAAILGRFHPENQVALQSSLTLAKRSPPTGSNRHMVVMLLTGLQGGCHLASRLAGHTWDKCCSIERTLLIGVSFLSLFGGHTREARQLGDEHLRNALRYLSGGACPEFGQIVRRARMRRWHLLHPLVAESVLALAGYNPTKASASLLEHCWPKLCAVLPFDFSHQHYFQFACRYVSSLFLERYGRPFSLLVSHLRSNGATDKQLKAWIRRVRELFLPPSDPFTPEEPRGELEWRRFKLQALVMRSRAARYSRDFATALALANRALDKATGELACYAPLAQDNLAACSRSLDDVTKA